MRIPKYLSPSAISTFYKNREEYYLKYCADHRVPRMPQTKPMSVGSAFDAFAKAWISEKLFGEIREGFDRQGIFEDQVEEANRDWAWIAGEWAWESYIKSGALADLMLELSLAAEEPRFEFTVQHGVSHSDCVDGIQLLGKPDIFFKTRDGAHVILDWKVNGYCSKSGVSPKAGYMRVRDGWTEDHARATRGHQGMHKTCQPMWIDGMEINVGKFFEHVDKSWADQLTIYGWVLGEAVGAPLIIGIEQLCCKPGQQKPLIRVASHRGYVSPKYQEALYQRALTIWKAVHNGHIFFEETFAESELRQLTLDSQHNAYGGDGPNDKWFEEQTRRHR